jgi:hypothetical protein
MLKAERIRQTRMKLLVGVLSSGLEPREDYDVLKSLVMPGLDFPLSLEGEGFLPAREATSGEARRVAGRVRGDFFRRRFAAYPSPRAIAFK